MSTVKIAVAGVGNCAAALYQGCALYHQFPDEQGLITQDIGPYGPGSVEVVAAFDVSAGKVGLPLRQAIFAEPNCCTLPDLGSIRLPDGPTVVPGPLGDGLGESHLTALRDGVVQSGRGDAVVEELRASGADVLVNFLPVGSTRATEAYALAALNAGVGFVNAIPVPIARDGEWHRKFVRAGLPLIGDDVKSQVGATITHRALAETYSHRGVVLDETYQLNVGGNTDFLNMRDEERLADKRRSKLQSINDVANRGAGVDPGHIHVGPSDYVPFLGDKKLAFVQLRGRGFGGNPILVEMRFEGGDSPNSAGVVYDAVRWAAWCRDLCVCGVINAPSSYLMKAPPEGLNVTDAQALEALGRFTEELIRGEGELASPAHGPGL